MCAGRPRRADGLLSDTCTLDQYRVVAGDVRPPKEPVGFFVVVAILKGF